MNSENNNIYTNDDRIIVEKHYIPLSLYREIYNTLTIPNHMMPLQTS